MKIAAAVILLLLIIVLGNEIYFFWKKNGAAADQYRTLETERARAQSDYDRLKADFTYYLNPANLEKELRARFNFRQPGEHLIIIIPNASSSNP